MTDLDWSGWHDASAPDYTAMATVVDGLAVTVCLNDEGPLRPAYYWDVATLDGHRLDDGWHRTVGLARQADVRTARRIAKEGG